MYQIGHVVLFSVIGSVYSIVLDVFFTRLLTETFYISDNATLGHYVVDSPGYTDLDNLL
jgi:hypothetical protein